MTDRPMNTPSGKVPGRGDYKGLYRSDPPALTAESGDVLPTISIGLSDLLGGIDGTDHGRRRVYNLSDEPLETYQQPYQRPCSVILGPVTADDDTHADDAETDAQVDDDQADAEADDARADVLTADYDYAEGLEL